MQVFLGTDGNRKHKKKFYALFRKYFRPVCSRTLQLYILSTSVSAGPEFYKLGAFSERLQCSRVSEPVTSLSDVAILASTDIESSDTATESATDAGVVNLTF